MNHTSPWHRPTAHAPLTRREFLWRSGGGLGGIALASLLKQESLLGGPPAGTPRLPPSRPRAKRVIQLFMAGAASHVDLWDYKPFLEKHHGEKWDPGEAVELFQDGLGSTFASPWKFRPYGQCGKHLSEVVAPLGRCVDDMAFIHNLVGKSGVHSQATLLQATGFLTPGFPGMGCWTSYGLGSLNENLPTFVVMPDLRGMPSNGAKNWDSAFLPAEHQGTLIRVGSENPIEALFPPADSGFITARSEADGLAALERLNRIHAAARPGDQRLEARIRTYELAARMQLAAPEALDLSKEPAWIQEAYGIDNTTRKWPAEINAPEETDIMGRKCLTARRLIERGVRFVQIWSGNDNSFPRRNWDSHENIAQDHGPLAMGMAKPIAALIEDLKQRGLLDDTILLWTTEFGRMPCAQGGKGRDHNPFVFTNWLCGGGIRGGITHGESDQWGYKPADRSNVTEVYDIHATIMHLLGIDHTRLTFRHNGVDRRLTDVHGEVIQPILA
ncbi:MAG: hypothetical protein RIT19_943 [Verrucomicrobiota bacterium]|jgi:hypothetical protein